MLTAPDRLAPQPSGSLAPSPKIVSQLQYPNFRKY